MTVLPSFLIAVGVGREVVVRWKGGIPLSIFQYCPSESTFLHVSSGRAGRQGQQVSISSRAAVKMTPGDNGERGRTRTRSWTGFMTLEYSWERQIILFKYFKSSSLRT